MRNVRNRKYTVDWEKTHLSLYQDTLLRTSSWVNNAVGLLDSAALLEPNVNDFWQTWRRHLKDKFVRMKSDKYISVYLMLISFAVENLLKAMIVREKRSEIVDELLRGRLPKILKSHDLITLSQLAQFPIKNELQEDLLRRLSRSAVWRGRYPIPLDYRSGRSVRFLDGKKYNISLDREIDLELIKELIKDIKQFGNFRSP
jgi:hypothetical protein